MEDSLPKTRLSLERSVATRRAAFSFILSALTVIATLLALLPLFSVLALLIMQGAPHLSVESFTSLPPAPLEPGGGFGNAVGGTLIMVGLASLLAVPLGVLAAVYLAECPEDSLTAAIVRFAAKVLTGVPSILAGVFAYALVVVALEGGFNPFAGAVALSLLMLPVVTLTAEQGLRQVPVRLKEAALGMGATQTQMICRVLLPTAMPTVLTGVMLAVARAAGETAPLLFTAQYNRYWISEPGEPCASLAVLIYNFSGVPYPNQINMAWAASLVLVVLVMMLNLVARRLASPTIRD